MTIKNSPYLVRAAMIAFCREHFINPDEITGPSRIARITELRKQVVRHLRAQGFTTIAIGKVLNRDHSSICYLANPERRKKIKQQQEKKNG